MVAVVGVIVLIVLSTWWMSRSGRCWGRFWVVPVSLPVAVAVLLLSLSRLLALVPVLAVPRVVPSDIPAVLPTSSCLWQRGLVRRRPCLIAPRPHPTSSCSRQWLGVLLQRWPSLCSGGGGYWVVPLVLVLVVVVFFVVLWSLPLLSRFHLVCCCPFVIAPSSFSGWPHRFCPVAPHFNPRATARGGGWECCRRGCRRGLLPSWSSPVVVFSHSSSFPAIHPASRGSQRRCCFVALLLCCCCC